jgi:hypothetical protein
VELWKLKRLPHRTDWDVLKTTVKGRRRLQKN